MKKRIWLLLTLGLLLLAALLPACASAEGTITVPASTKIIEEEAFLNVQADRVILPEGLERIESRAFTGSRLTSISLPASLTYMADDALEGAAVSSVTAQEGTYAYAWAYQHKYIHLQETPAEDFEYSISDGTVTITKYKGRDTSVVIPAVIDGKEVRSIGHGAFKENKGLTSVTIPNSVKTIEWGVFLDCTGLISVTIPNSVTSIGDGAFESCTGLTSVTIPNSVTAIGEYTFAGCTSLTDVTIPNSITSIGRRAFINCKSLTSIEIPDSVTVIEYEAFGYCDALISVTIPNSVTSMEDHVFYSCENLKSVTIPDSVTSIGNEVLCHCVSLTSVTIPNGLTSIGDLMFCRCMSLTSVTIPDSVTSIGKYAFYKCESLTSVTIPDSVTWIGDYAFSGISGFVAYVYEGSYAETYCIEKKIPYQIIKESDIVDLINVSFILVMKEYINSEGYIDENDIPSFLSSMVQCAEQALREGKIEEYHVEGNAIWYVDSILHHVWICEPAIEGLLSSGNENEILIISYDFEGSGHGEDAGKAISNAISYYELSHTYKSSEVDLNSLSSLGKDQIVFIITHGTVIDGNVCFSLGMKYNDSMEKDDSPYRDAFRNKELYHKLTSDDIIGDASTGLYIAKNKGRVVVTPQYIRKYCPNMDNSFIWIGACHSADNNSLLKAFTEKGAVAYVGYKSEVGVGLNKSMVTDTIKYMLKTNQSTGKHYTLSEAIDKAWDDLTTAVHPINNIQNWMAGTKPAVYNGDFSLWRGTVSGNVWDSDGVTPLKNVKINFINISTLKNTILYTGEDGSYTAHLPKGNYDLRVSNENAASAYEPNILRTRVAVDDEGYYEMNWLRMNDSFVEPVQQEFGTVNGQIYVAGSQQPIGGAVVAFYRDSALYKKVTANASGAFTLSALAGNYKVVTSAEGYKTLSGNFTVIADEENYFETFLMVIDKEGEGTVKGSITNAFTGEKLEGVSLTFREGWNNLEEGSAIATSMTDSGGNYTVKLPLGYYTAIASKDGFITGSFNIAVNPGVTVNQNGSIEPETIALSDVVIRLEWGDSPADLDSHLVGTNRLGDSFHVYFRNKNASMNGEHICNLDTDDTNGYGPEHITLHVDSEKPYYYYVYNFSKSGLLGNSGAKVSLYINGELNRVFHVPATQDTGYYWNVFAIIDGQVVARNTITSSAETEYADKDIDCIVSHSIGNYVLIDHRTTRVDLTLSIEKPKGVIDEHQNIVKMPEDVYVELKMDAIDLLKNSRGEIQWSINQPISGGNGSSTIVKVHQDPNDSRIYIFHFPVLSNAYGSVTVTCDFVYSFDQDTDDIFNIETIQVSVKWKDQEETKPKNQEIKFGTMLLGLDEAVFKQTYYEHLKTCLNAGGNPMNDPVIDSILFDELMNLMPKSLIEGYKDFSSGVNNLLALLQSADSIYQGIYLCSFYEYEKAIVDKGESEYIPSDNCLYYRVLSDGFVDKGSNFEGLWFHEAGHAADFVSSDKKHRSMTQDEILSGEIKSKLTEDVDTLLKLYMMYFRQLPEHRNIDDTEAEAILQAIKKPENKCTTNTDIIMNNLPVFTVRPPERIEDPRYIDDYIDFVQYACVQLFNTNNDSDVETSGNAYSIERSNNKQSIMISDIVGGLTNNAVHAGDHHGVDEHGNDTYYWYDERGNDKGILGMEAWAEYFASRITESKSDARFLNEMIFGETTNYFNKTLAQKILKACKAFIPE